MQRYSGGLQVPKMQIESFQGKTTNGGGEIVVTLKYTPKSLGHIATSMPYVAADPNYQGRVTALAGKDVTVTFYEYTYQRADLITTVNSGNAGADPHLHGITSSIVDVDSSVLDAVTVPAFGIVYEIG